MRQRTRFLLYVLDELVIALMVAFVVLYFQVDLWIAAGIFLFFTGLFVFLIYIFLPQLRQPVTGSEGLVGRQGVAVERLVPSGQVRVRGELWDAESLEGVLEAGEQVVVTRVEGLHLFVKKH